MKSKVLITIIIWCILNVLLVNSQEAKCPPDCSSPSKITETSYLDSNSYNDKKFYENSDPKKWNFRDPNFDYSKIPLAKYKELPYTNPDIDHSRLDPNKYISAFGCSTCTFRIATTQKIQYSTDGVLHAKIGLARIPGNFPPNTLFIATNEGIFIGLPKIDEKSMLDISNVGSATIITNNQKVTLSNGLTIDGKLSFKDNQAFVSKNNELTLEGIKIKPKGNDVLVYFDGQQHQGNYVSYGEKKLIAEGNNIDLEFTSENKLVKVFWDRSILRGTPISNIIYNSPELLQDDYLFISVGDGQTKSGKIQLSNRENKNLLPLLETNGFIRLWNDRNDVSVDGTIVNQQFYSALPTTRQGSVSLQMITDWDTERVYTFDENRKVLILNKEQSKRIDELRNNILQNHYTILTGFFDESELKDFDYSLKSIENNLGIDFSKIKEVHGKPLEILENDIKTSSRRAQQFAAAIASVTEPRAIWLRTIKASDTYRITSYTSDESVGDSGTLTHEIAHILTSNRPDFDNRLIEKASEFGITLTTPRFGLKNKGPDELFPSEYSKQNREEFKAEIFKEMVHNPSWFQKPGKDDLFVQLGFPIVSDEVIKQRQAFRDIWLEELKNYKK